MARLISSINENPILLAPSRSNLNRPFLPHRSMVVKMSTTVDQSYWASVNADVEAHLRQAIPIRPPHEVFRPMNHFTFSAPRTAAPGLCVAACELVGGQRDQAVAAASALRVMHAASCTRRNIPFTGGPITSNGFGPNIELMTSDGLVPLGIELVSMLDDPAQNNSDQVLRVIVEMSHAMGSEGMAEGLYNKLLHYGQGNGKETLEVEYIDRVCKKKEGVLHACAGACGAILGGGSEEEIEKLRKLGLYFGIIQGLKSWEAKKEKWVVKKMDELRGLALEELRGFSHTKVELISSLFLCHQLM